MDKQTWKGTNLKKQTTYYLATLYIIHRSILSSVNNIEEEKEEPTDEGTPQ